MARADNEKIVAIAISVFLSFGLWLYVMGQTNPMKDRTIDNIPVELTNIDNVTDSNFAIIPGQNYSITVTLTGRTFDIAKIDNKNIKAVADLSGYLKKGDNNIPVKIVDLPSNIKLANKYEYPSIIVKLDSLGEKSVPVSVNITGTIKEGYGAMTPILKPSDVLVSGPASYVAQVESVIAQINLNDAYKDISGIIPLKAVDKDGKQISNVTINPRDVSVSIPIKSSKVVPVVVKTTGKLKSNKVLKSIKPEKDFVVIVGEARDLDKVTEIETVPYDITNIATSGTLSVPLKVPANIKVENNVDSINVEFIVENKLDKEITLPVGIINEKDEFSYIISNTDITAILSGAESVISPIDNKSISAYVDVSGLAEGEHSLPVKIASPQGVDIVSITPQKIGVTINKK